MYLIFLFTIEGDVNLWLPLHVCRILQYLMGSSVLWYDTAPINGRFSHSRISLFLKSTLGFHVFLFTPHGEL